MICRMLLLFGVITSHEKKLPHFSAMRRNGKKNTIASKRIIASIKLSSKYF